MAFKSRFSHATPDSEYAGSVRPRLSGIVGSGTSPILISLKVIFFEPSTQSGLGGRFLDGG
jgi:hypothetical protein